MGILTLLGTPPTMQAAPCREYRQEAALQLARSSLPSHIGEATFSILDFDQAEAGALPFHGSTISDLGTTHCFGGTSDAIVEPSLDS